MKNYMPLIVFLFAGFIGAWVTLACDAGSDGPGGASDDNNGDNDNDNNDGNNNNDSSDNDNDDSGDDDDDNGLVDPEADCECGESLDSTSAEDMGMAMNICPGVGDVLDAELWSTSPNPAAGFAILESMGNNDCLVYQHGCQMVAISTGPVGQANPNPGDGPAFGETETGGEIANDPLPPFQGENPTTSTLYESCDNLQLRFRLKAPEGAEGFSFDFIYASAEYDEWINMGYNDAFYAILQYPGLNDGEPTNISFDDNEMEIEVDVNFFENPDHPCDESGSGWGPACPSVSGSTGWLRTIWPVEEGAEFNITFSIHDEGDCIYDSIVFIDNWQWQGEVEEPGTGPI